MSEPRAPAVKLLSQQVVVWFAWSSRMRIRRGPLGARNRVASTRGEVAFTASATVQNRLCAFGLACTNMLEGGAFGALALCRRLL